MSNTTRSTAIPATMRALELPAYNGIDSLKVVQKPVPKPGSNQVLIKVHAAPVNPSDLMYLIGAYGLDKGLPAIPGFEGSGTVVGVGSGVLPRFYLGRNVSFVAANDGSWAEYTVVPALQAIPLPKSISLDQGAMLFVNPLTALMLMDIAKRGKHRAIVQTAASSMLGQMIVRLGADSKFPILNIVRRPEQVAKLQSLGAKYVLDSSSSDFNSQLKAMLKELKPTLALDAVGGEVAAKLFHLLPDNSEMISYGNLSLSPVEVHPSDFIFNNKNLRGFWLATEFMKLNMVQQLLMATRVQRLLGSELSSEIHRRAPLEQAVEALKEYEAHMSRGKLLLMPGLASNEG